MTASRRNRIPKSVGLVVVIFGLMRPVVARAQTLTGVVIDESTQQKVGGAQLTLRDANHVRVGFVLSDSGGRFVLRAPAPGEYDLQAERLGFTTLQITLQLDSAITYVRRIDMPATPLAMQSIVASAARPCGGARATQETALLWEDIRKALETVSLSAELPAIDYRALEYTRNLDRWKKVHAQDTSTVSLTGTHGPYRSAPVDSLLDYGFIQPDAATGAFEYFGPDAEVLLSSRFLNAYCFEQAPARERPGLAGLRFRPAATDSVPGIHGTIWADTKTRELVSLDFKYDRLPLKDSEIDAGGLIEFSRLLNGPWIVTRWVLTAPRFVEQARPDGGRELFFGGYRQLERVVLEGHYADGRVAFRRPGTVKN